MVLGYHNFQFITTGQNTAYLEEHIIRCDSVIRNANLYCLLFVLELLSFTWIETNLEFFYYSPYKKKKQLGLKSLKLDAAKMTICKNTKISCHNVFPYGR